MTINQDDPAFLERRKHPRFKVSERACVACWPDPVIIATIVDISKHGIAFSYPVEQSLPDALTEVGILLTGASFIVSKNQFQSVSDTEIIGHPMSTVKMRRHSGYFLEPTTHELERFIENHMLGEV